ncbi:MAG TPA: type II toxin-antitoxin system prevent-host-death family antitoxin [Ilumatobacter sp.]|nr:type II toxin-antitoxin system prevent-host-death family antitoxin [Ilumatobacter sp.]
MTVTFSLHEAKAKLSHLITLAEAGETVEITRHGKVVARLTGADFEPRRPGWGVGTVEYLGEFEFTEAEIDEMFYGDIEP